LKNNFLSSDLTSNTLFFKFSHLSSEKAFVPLHSNLKLTIMSDETKNNKPQTEKPAEAPVKTGCGCGCGTKK
jgi:hypothetical protein